MAQASPPSFAGGASAATQPATGPDTPAGIEPAQWQRLVAELSAQPGGAKEIKRLAAYYRYSDAARRFRELRRQSPGSPELASLAQTLDQGLDQRLQQGEMSAPEARQMKLALLEVTQPDPAVRQALLSQWVASQQAGQPAAGPSAADPREQEFLRRQAALVAAWQAQPPAQRDSRLLQQQLQDLRRTSFDPQQSNPGGKP